MNEPKHASASDASTETSQNYLQYVLVILLNILYLCIFYWINQHYS